MANEQNLRPIHKGDLTIEECRERARNGGKKSVEVRRAKKTMAEMLQSWADCKLQNKGEISKLKEMGFDVDESITNKMSLLIPLLDNVKKKGDMKSMQMIVEMLNEDKKKEAEIRKLEAEIEKLKKETSGEITDTKITIINDIPKEII